MLRHRRRLAGALPFGALLHLGPGEMIEGHVARVAALARKRRAQSTPGTRASAGTCSVSYQAWNAVSTSGAGLIATSSSPPASAGPVRSPGRICSPSKRSRRRHLPVTRFDHGDRFSPPIAR